MLNENVGNVALTQAEKAGRWDHLIRLLKTGMRRATMALLARREELPKGLVTELKSYRAKLDGLWFEAADGWADTNMLQLINVLPLYGLGSLVGELCQGNDHAD